ncbi:MAG: indolepyruvate oxidoreductase subunit beta [Bacteroidales bacterium]|jgi:indolepyruvate ferredoxin oxidoreductase beta subunit|nr:indolepyruvate oxidoreductase subunit beta [Bacteroidales bacterium]MBR2887387.1 indolepyruvate oxidoreductase subunit beta [Bacteroidales bacterium]MBR6177514.1 indolepyruvate oxidoreductase subunit beta [Bacteroidales bacterium]MDD6003842.1 indolepyruvate oxidoreductase subunit beta [Bacteroidales bacterium]
MKTDIILAGVGGQGILSIASCIGVAAMNENLYVKQSELHGMSQRGGAVQSHFRLSDKPVYSDQIPLGEADIILSVEPMEALRYLPWLSAEGMVVTDSTPFINIPNYPEPETITAEIKKLKKHVLIDANSLATEIKSPKSANIVMLGAASKYLQVSFKSLENALEEIFKSKGAAVVDVNKQALNLGREYAEKYIRG